MEQIRAMIVVLIWVLLSGITASATSQEVDYEQDGPYATGQVMSHLIDSVTSRSVDLITVFPSEDGEVLNEAAGTCQLVVFSHGFLLHGEQYLSYAERLASYGFIVGLPTYRESIVNVDHRALAEDLQNVIDYYAAMNAAEQSPFYQRIDTARVGLSGHSLGGKISLLAAVYDDRIAVCALLDPVDSAPFGEHTESSPKFPSVTPELMPGIQIPLLLVGAEFGGTPVVLLGCAPPEDNYQQYYDYANSPAIEITQVGAGHLQYVEGAVSEAIAWICAAGTADTNWVRESATAYITAYLVAVLGEENGAMDWLARRLEDDQAAGRIRVRRK